MSLTAAPDPAELVAWYAEMGITEALDEVTHDHFAAPAASEAPRPRPVLPPRAGQPAPASVRPNAAAATAPDDAALSARTLAQGAETLEALKEALARFEGCVLKATAKSLVFADGNPNGRVMIVGEAPGADEDRIGLPFVGRSGQLLDRMLAAIGLSRKDDVYIANLLPWRPPGNRTPTPQEVAICLPFIQRQIQLADPDILLCIGGPSAQGLLGLSGILASRGKWLEYDTGTRRIPAMATLHPAYLLRQPLQKRLAWRDMRALRAALDKAP
ncbi:uracil-DNA glycosylase [Bosea sp. (in: a-proteobacteria)]|uniref:uracil-DNA glycosylase n=1 Tax=Bosea sp. (in: a-proteobacteria) TaxID=1871050 RepID=UPI002B477703|nr:uracil-DNA glycosylase [Bosea sp. (in: a-proteobacteria)]WRH57976.1 MAG: uracil-DNA glycosylase [Bosea sp. (in: a-proteobacteria)]